MKPQQHMLITVTLVGHLKDEIALKLTLIKELNNQWHPTRSTS